MQTLDPARQQELFDAYQQQLAINEQQQAQLTQQQQQLQQLLASSAQASPTVAPTIHLDEQAGAAPPVTYRPSEPRPPKPDTFDGLRLSTSRCNASTWLAEIKQYLVAAGVAEARRVEHAATYLKGTALTWWLTYRQLSPALAVSWEQFESWFLTRFQPIAASKTARVTLRALRQRPGRPVASYNDEFMRVMTMITDMNEIDQIEYYKAGLADRAVAAWVDRREPKTLMQAMEHAQLEDMRAFELSRGRQGFYRPAGSPLSAYQSGAGASASQQSVPMELGLQVGDDDESKYDSYTEPCAWVEQSGSDPQLSNMSRRPGTARRPFSSPGASVSTAGVPKLTPAERERCIKEHLCFRCRQKGHGSLNCPMFLSDRRGAGVQSGKGRAQ